VKLISKTISLFFKKVYKKVKNRRMIELLPSVSQCCATFRECGGFNYILTSLESAKLFDTAESEIRLPHRYDMEYIDTVHDGAATINSGRFNILAHLERGIEGKLILVCFTSSLLEQLRHIILSGRIL
jgi:hypothetical protein